MGDVFFRQPSGDTYVAGRLSVHGDEDDAGTPVLPADAEVISEAEYDALQATQTSARDAELVDVGTAIRERAHADYDTLVAGGISPAAATIITGYTPEEG